MAQISALGTAVELTVGTLILCAYRVSLSAPRQARKASDHGRGAPISLCQTAGA